MNTDGTINDGCTKNHSVLLLLSAGQVLLNRVVKMLILYRIWIAQTFLDICGVKSPKDMQGASIVPLLKGKKPKDWRKSLYYQYPAEDPSCHSARRHYGVRTDRYKLIHFYMLDGWELYDLKKDPNELNSLYGKKGSRKDYFRRLKR